MIWTLYGWLNKFLQLNMVGVVIIGGEHDLRIEAHHRSQSCKTKLLFYELLLSLSRWVKAVAHK